MKFEDIYKEYNAENMVLVQELTGDLLKLYDAYHVQHWFKILLVQEDENDEMIPKKVCRRLFSVSFFRASVDCHGPERREDDPSFLAAAAAAAAAAWEEKYWKGLTRLAQKLESSDTLRVYMSQELHAEGYTAKLREIRQRSLQIFVMESNSIGAQPGMLWRFLPFFDVSIITAVIVVDIDEDVSPQRFAMIKNFETSGKSFGRFVSYGGVDGEFHVCRESTAKNYAAVLGSLVMCRPSRSQLQISLLTRFVLTFMKRGLEYGTSSTPVSDYDHPIHDHKYGWGAHWTMYGFDERFLKHVLLYHFAKRGSMISFVHRNALSRDEVIADLEFIRSNSGNLTLFFL